MENLVKILIIITATFALYWRSLKYKYVSDDIPVYKNPPKFKNAWHKRLLQFLGSAKIKPKEDRLITIGIHSLICVMIFLAFGRNDISFLAALLFAFNPTNNQGSIWISGRGYTLPALALVSAVAFPILAPWLLLFCSWFTAGFFAPVALLGSKYWFLLFLLPIIWGVHYMKFKTAVKSKHTSETLAEDKRFHIGKIILAIKTFGFYLALCVVPFRITFYHSFLQSCAGNEIMRKRAYSLCKFFWIGLTSILAWLVYSCFHWDMISWGFLWYAVNIAPYCNLIRLNQEIAERFVYIANIGVMLLLANFISGNIILSTAFIVFYATRTFFVMPMYKDDYFITEVAVIEDPNAWWAWHCRAMKRWDTKSYHEALILWVMASLISPKEFKLLMNIATVLRLLKNDKEADHYLKLAQENIVEGQEEQALEFIKKHKSGQLPILL